MKIGISVSSSYPDIAPNLAVNWMVARTRAANAAGLDHLFVGDHHSTKTPYFQNNVMLGRMLAEWGDKPFGALYLPNRLVRSRHSQKAGSLCSAAWATPGRVLRWGLI